MQQKKCFVSHIVPVGREEKEKEEKRKKKTKKIKKKEKRKKRKHIKKERKKTLRKGVVQDQQKKSIFLKMYIAKWSFFDGCES